MVGFDSAMRVIVISFLFTSDFLDPMSWVGFKCSKWSL